MKLKYLFTVEYKDGSVYQQNEEDVSLTDPLRSCFFDVKQEEVKTFTLKGDGHTYMVDLENGHFEVDGVAFWFHEMPLQEFRLIFFRQHTHHFKPTGEETAHEIVYRMGWQSTMRGKNYQEVMQIK